MPYRNIPGTNTRYALVAFDSDGKERADDPDGVQGRMSERLLADAATQAPTHIMLFSHGWKGDLNSAKDQYDRWIKAMNDRKEGAAALGSEFRPLWIGLHWPSQPFGEGDFGDVDFSVPGGEGSPADVVDAYAARLDVAGSQEARGLIRKIVDANRKDAAADEMPADVADAYRKLASLAGYEAKGAGAAPGSDGEAFDPVQRFEAGNEAELGADFGGGGILGGLLGPLRQLSFWRMKKRARTVGEGGMHDFVANLMKKLPSARFQLMGHSFGCIVMSALAGGKDGKTALPRPVDSLVLVQGAMSLWSYSKTVPDSSSAGYFHEMMKRGAVRGPIVTTQSIHDKAVGVFYPIAVAAVLSGAEFDVNSLPKYGAIGKHGIRGLDGDDPRPMLDVDAAYNFQPGKLYNLEGSKFISKGGGASGAHSDIDGPQVAHILWQAALV